MRVTVCLSVFVCGLAECVQNTDIKQLSEIMGKFTCVKLDN